jgi:O-antigen/teichoic acid export membrane protein
MLTAAAIADRGLLGIAMLVTTVLVGRWAGPDELGLFALFFPIAFAAIALQESLITAPYTIFATDLSCHEARRRYLGSVLLHTGVLSGISCAVLAGVAALLQARGMSAYAAAAAVLAPVVPCILLREFARRVVYADLKPQTAAVISAAASIVQLLVMVALYAAGRLTAVTAFAAIGVSSVVVGVAWVIAERETIRFDATTLASSFARNWRLGRWITAAQVGDVVRIHMFPWLLALALDHRSVGIYAACAAVAGLSGPLQIAISNLLLPQFGAAAAKGGVAAADRLMWQATAWLVAAMAVFTLAVGGVSGVIVPWMYGAEYVGSQTPLVLLLLAQLIIAASLPAARALVALRRPDMDFMSHAAGIAINLAAGLPLVLGWGITGAAAAGLLGAAAKAALTAVFYTREMRAQRSDASWGAPALSEPSEPPPTPRSSASSMRPTSYSTAGAGTVWAEELS